MSEDRFVATADGVRLAVRDHGGDGPAMVLLHGLGEHLLAVEDLAAQLVAACRVVAMDLRWSGQSGSAPHYDWDAPVADVETVIRALELGNPFVAGHSWGGIVAVRYGIAHPAAPGVVNIDGWGFGEPDLYDGMDHADAARVIESLRDKVDPLAAFPRTGDADWAAGARQLMGNVLKGRGVAPERLDEWVDRMFLDLGHGRWRLQPDPVVYDAMRTDARVFDLLDAVECPTLVIASDVATATTEVVAARRRGVAARLRALQPRKPNLAVTTIPGSDHNSLLTTHAGAVASAIQGFMA